MIDRLCITLQSPRKWRASFGPALSSHGPFRYWRCEYWTAAAAPNGRVATYHEARIAGLVVSGFTYPDARGELFVVACVALTAFVAGLAVGACL